MKLYVRLVELLKERNLTQVQLNELIKEKTGKELRAAAISELANNQRRSINREHLERIAKALDITEINKLITLEIDETEKR
mgnify:CR=1 FL=1